MRQVHGVSVRFYKRTEAANLTMDFEVLGQRIQESTGWPTMKDAERAADKRVRELKEKVQGLLVHEAKVALAKGKVSTVKQALDLMDSQEGRAVWKPRTRDTYRAALVRLAKAAAPEAHEAAGLDVVLCEKAIDGFYAAGQGLARPNWTEKLPMNAGLNTTVRNVKALFNSWAVKQLFHSLKLPDLRELEKALFLHAPAEGFVPWPAEVYATMHAASEGLRQEKPELWLVNALLRRLGLRDEELLEARREWIEVQYVAAGDGMGPPQRRAWLAIQNRGVAFTILKHGAARRLELDWELQELLLPRTGHLVADGWAPTTRYKLIYRLHSQWLRPLLPTGVDHAKTNHQLRMYAGSMIYTTHGLEAAAYFLGHKSQETTEKYYAAWLGAAPMLDGTAVAMRGDAVIRKQAA